MVVSARSYEHDKVEALDCGADDFITASIINVKEESDIDSFLSGVQGSLFTEEIRGLDDFELICFLVIK